MAAARTATGGYSAAWLRSSACLDGMDIDSVRSLNGSRVAERILALVPSLPPFRLALRAVRCWAKRRCVVVFLRQLTTADGTRQATRVVAKGLKSQCL